MAEKCQIDACGKPVLARGWCSTHYRRWWRGSDPQRESKKERATRLRRFVMETLASRDRERCWVDGEFSLNEGYPRIGKKPVGHLAMELDGRPRPEGLEMCHSCDDRLCWNPAHLRWDTRLSNVKDMVERERHRTGNFQGERNPASILTEQDVLSIRRRAVVGGPFGRPSGNLRHLAEEFGVSYQAVHDVVARKTWPEVQRVLR